MRPQLLKHLVRVVHVSAASSLAATFVCMNAVAGTELSPAQAYYDFVHWVSVGRLDRALDQFAVDAVVVAGPRCSSQDPCIGKVAIRERYMSALKQQQVPLPLIDQRFDGRHLRTCGDGIPVPAGHSAGVPPSGGHEIELKGGRIVALRFEPSRCSVSWATFESGQGIDRRATGPRPEPSLEL